MSFTPCCLAGRPLTSLLILPLLAFTTHAETPPRSDRASPELAGFIENLRQSHPLMQEAESGLAVARSRLEAAAQPLYNPEIELDAEDAVDRTVSLGISQTLDWADKRASRKRIGENELNAVQMRLLRTRQQLSLRILSSLSDYHAAMRRLSMARKNHAIMTRFDSIAGRRFRAGEIGEVDRGLAQLALSTASMAMADAEVALIDARQSLEQASAISRKAWPALPDMLPSPERQPSDPQVLLTRLPELRLLSAEMQTSKARIELLDRKRRPDPTVSIRGGAEASTGLVGINLSIPLFLRNTFRAEVDAASNEAITSERRVLTRFRVASARYRNAARRYLTSYAAYQQWRKTGQPVIEKRYALLTRLLENGEINTTQYLIQVRETLTTESTGITLFGRAWHDWFEWLDASGSTDDWLGIDARQ